MYEYGERNAEAAALAQKCLAEDGQHVEALIVYNFEDDVATISTGCDLCATVTTIFPNFPHGQIHRRTRAL